MTDEELIEKIGEMIDKKIKDALTVDIDYEQVRDHETGQPLAKTKLKKLKVYLPEHWVEFLPFHEAALRGVQEQVTIEEKSKRSQLETIVNILLQFEGSMKQIVEFSHKLRISSENNKQIEDKSDGISSA